MYHNASLTFSNVTTLLPVLLSPPCNAFKGIPFIAILYSFSLFAEFYISPLPGSLTKAEKELIVIATSAKNNCLYCVVAHSAVHRIYSKNPYVADQVGVYITCTCTVSYCD